MTDPKLASDEAETALESILTEAMCEDLNPTGDRADLLTAIQTALEAMRAQAAIVRKQHLDPILIIMADDQVYRLEALAGLVKSNQL